MHLNLDPVEPTRLPCIRDFAQLTDPATGLLPPTLVALVPLPELERRAAEIDATHPQYREETPLVLRFERQRRQRLSGELRVAGGAAPGRAEVA